MMPLRRPETWPESEAASREALQHWLQEEGGYVHIQGTRPQTLAYGLQDSPVGPDELDRGEVRPLDRLPRASRWTTCSRR